MPPPASPREHASTPWERAPFESSSAPRSSDGAGEFAAPLERSTPLDPRDLAGRLCELCGEHAGATLTHACALVRRAQELGGHVAWIGARGSSFFPPDLADAGIDLAALAVVRVPEPEHAERERERRAPGDRDRECLARGGRARLERAHEPLEPRTRRRGARDLAQAADLLVRSDAFDLVVVDLAASRSRVSLAALTRLAGLARAHACAIVFLTRKRPDEPSLGSLISLRGDATHQRTRPRPEPEFAPGREPEREPERELGHETGSAREQEHALECALRVTTLRVTKDRRQPRGWSRSERCDGPPGLR